MPIIAVTCSRLCAGFEAILHDAVHQAGIFFVACKVSDRKPVSCARDLHGAVAARGRDAVVGFLNCSFQTQFVPIHTETKEF